MLAPLALLVLVASASAYDYEIVQTRGDVAKPLTLAQDFSISDGVCNGQIPKSLFPCAAQLVRASAWDARAPDLYVSDTLDTVTVVRAPDAAARCPGPALVRLELAC